LGGTRATGVLGAGHFTAHVEAPVRFRDGLAALAAEAPDLLIETGPHPILLDLAGDVPELTAARIATLERGGDDDEIFLGALGRAFVAGAPVRLAPAEGRPQLFVVAAKSEAALRAQAGRLAEHVERNPAL